MDSLHPVLYHHDHSLDHSSQGFTMGKRAWLAQLLEQDILPAIAPLKNTPHGRKKCQHLAQQLRDRWSEHGQSTLKQQQSL
jgi:hypothetical protein